MRQLALIVDDDLELHRAMTAQLTSMDFDVLGAHHYDAAVDRLTERRPEIVCVDLELPTKSGYELCEYIRGPLGLIGVPILVTSAFGFPRTMASAEEAGANAFLKKPFSMRQLANYVEALLDQIVNSEPYMRRLRP